MNDTGTTRSERALTIPRSKGAGTGLALVLLGLWGALIPFVGPSFDYAYTPSDSWHWTAARGVLEVVPGAVAFLAGVTLVWSANRAAASFAGFAALLAGIWFVVGPLLAPIWDTSYLGAPIGGTTKVSVEQIGIFYGLGAAIVLFAAFALGRFSVLGVRDLAASQRHADRRSAGVGRHARSEEPELSSPSAE